MPVKPSYPGVYIEEVPSEVRAIVGVSTSVTAFVGYFSRGPLDKAVQLFNIGDFQREFGGLRPDSEVGYAIQQFFLNGGNEAWVVRTAAGSIAASSTSLTDADGNTVLNVEAASEGEWGDSVRLDVDYDTSDPETSFNLIVTEFSYNNGRLQPNEVETFRNLTMDDGPDHVVDVVNDGSALIRLEFPTTAGPSSNRPAQAGTTGAEDLSAMATDDIDDLNPDHWVTVNVSTADGSFSGEFKLESSVESPAQVRATLQTQLRTIAGLEQATVELIGGYLRVKAGVEDPDAVISFTDDSGSLASDLGLEAGTAIERAQAFALEDGDDGELPGAEELIGDRDDKAGLYALEDVDLFNILSVPGTAALDDTNAIKVLTDALAYCEERRAFMIVDSPKERETLEEVKGWVDDNASTLRHKNAALYFPRVKVADALNNFRLRSIPASGTMAGLYARTDGDRGVWKAPAGIEATQRGVQELEIALSDSENGVLNPLGINALRTFPIIGSVSWGARTLRGADRLASQWKYVPVRRTALFIEESLYRGLQWAVFEPNAEPLWAQIRLNVGAFMQNLFRQGAFQGETPREAYFVKCDGETTIQNDIDRGIVNVLVGFAPLKPAEFVILKISQIAGDIQT